MEFQIGDCIIPYTSFGARGQIRSLKSRVFWNSTFTICVLLLLDRGEFSFLITCLFHFEEMFGRVFSRRVLSSSSSRAAYSRSTRVRGGHDHGHGHGHHAPAGPYDAPHHATYPNEAYLFGINPKVPYENQGWEWVTLITYIVGAGILITGATTKPLDSFKVCTK